MSKASQSVSTSLIAGSRHYPSVPFIALLSLVLVMGNHLLQGAAGLNLADEGFLWYGTLQTAAGEVPIRDFQSYDPGRYYWTAAWSFLFGDGIMGLRLSLALFQGLGLCCGLLAARSVIPNRWSLIPVAVVLIIWMLPRYKPFEHSLSLAAVFFGTRLLEKPSEAGRHFLAGLFVGLAGFFGRNHGLYTSLAFLVLLVFLWWKLDDGWTALMRRLRPWIAGVLTGSVPWVVIILLVPGFFESFVESVLMISKLGATNLTIAVPWPWTIELSSADWIVGASRLSTGVSFLGLPVFLILGIGVAAATSREQLRSRALLISCTAVGLFYVHHAFARADFSHLAQSSQPFLLGSLALPFACGPSRGKTATLVWGAVLTLTVLGAVPFNAGVQVKRNSAAYELYQIGNDQIWIPRVTARLIDETKEVAGRIAPPEGLLVLSRWPGLYCIVGKRSPLHEIYLTHPETKTRQKAMIAEINDKNVRCAILDDMALDGQDERRLSRTNPILWEYLISSFESVDAPGLKASQQARCRD